MSLLYSRVVSNSNMQPLVNAQSDNEDGLDMAYETPCQRPMLTEKG